MRYDSIIEKFNPYHDKKGRFSTADGANSVTVFTRNPEKQYLADKYKERAKRKDRVKRACKPVEWNEKSMFRFYSDMDIPESFKNRCEQVFGSVYYQAKSILEKANGVFDPEKGMLEAYEINEIVGNTGKPDIVSHEKFTKLIDDGFPDMYRGFDHKVRDEKVVKSDAEKAQDFINGSKFVGSGLYGSGTYVSMVDPEYDDSGLETALGYAFTFGPTASSSGKNNIVRMTVKNDAVIVNGKDFKDEYETFKNQISKVLDGQRVEYALGRLTDEERNTFDELRALESLFSDPGNYAAARGFDGYTIEDTNGYCVIVNNGALVIDEKILSSNDYR